MVAWLDRPWSVFRKKGALCPHKHHSSRPCTLDIRAPGSGQGSPKLIICDAKTVSIHPFTVAGMGALPGVQPPAPKLEQEGTQACPFSSRASGRPTPSLSCNCARCPSAACVCTAPRGSNTAARVLSTCLRMHCPREPTQLHAHLHPMLLLPIRHQLNFFHIYQ